MEWSQKAIVADIQGRWILQRKVFVQEEAQALHKFLALSSSEIEDKDAPLKASQLNIFKEELHELDKQLWDHARLCWKVEAEIPFGAKRGPSKHTGRIQIGISVHGYAGTVLDAVVAVDKIVGAARSREQLQHITNGIGAIAPVPVVAVFASRAVMLAMPESK